MKRVFSILCSFLLLLACSTDCMAQEMAFDMRSNGKIYVVVFVLATIFAGIFCFLVYLERKMKKIETKK
jgi:hypothetical protein